MLDGLQEGIALTFEADVNKAGWHTLRLANLQAGASLARPESGDVPS